jgi:hypothetical protein
MAKGDHNQTIDMFWIVAGYIVSDRNKNGDM